MTGLYLKDFSVTIAGRELLHIEELRLPATGLVGVIGPNGAGKSTLLKALAGLLPHRGHKALGADWPAARRIGFLPQDFSVRSALSVAECVLLGRRERLGWRINSHDLNEVDRALSEFGLAHLAHERMDSLSGGQQQMVLLAQRLSRDPQLLILDEPTSALDLHRQIEVLTHLKAIQHKDILVIAALHDLTLAGRFSDSLVLIKQGRLRAVGAPQEVLTQAVLDPVYAIACECLQDRTGNPVIVPHRDTTRSTGAG